MATNNWLTFFKDAGVESSVSMKYAATFVQNSIGGDILEDLNKVHLQEMGITALGDIIRILKHAKRIVKEDLSIKYHDFRDGNAYETSSKIADSLNSEVIKEEEILQDKLINHPIEAEVPNQSGNLRRNIKSLVKQDDLWLTIKEAQAEEHERLCRIQTQQQKLQKEFWERIQQGRLQQQHAKRIVKNDLSIQYHDFGAENASENSSKIAGCLKGDVIKEEELIEIVDDPTGLRIPNRSADEGEGAEVEYEPIAGGCVSRKRKVGADIKNEPNTGGCGSKNRKRNRKREGTGGHYCCVEGCHSNQYAHGPQGIKFYRIPRASKSAREAERRNKWIFNVGRINEDRSPWYPNNNTRICSKHFISGRKNDNPENPDFIPTVDMPGFRVKKMKTG